MYLELKNVQSKRNNKRRLMSQVKRAHSALKDTRKDMDTMSVLIRRLARQMRNTGNEGEEMQNARNLA